MKTPAKILTVSNVGHCSPHDRAFLRDVQTVLKTSGFYLWKRARGPRKVNALAVYRSPRAFDQSMPLQYAERFGLYVRENVGAAKVRAAQIPTSADWQTAWRLRDVAAARAAGRVEAVRELYRLGILPVRPAAPLTFRTLCRLAWQWITQP